MTNVKYKVIVTHHFKYELAVISSAANLFLEDIFN